MDWYSMTNARIELEIGLRIKNNRIKRNLTQLELANKVGISRVAISKIERGKGVTLSSLIGILRMLGLLQNIEYLFPEDEISPIEVIKLKGKKRKRASTKKK
ncbi:helix-turn-helix transcriptional regulator [Flavobacteriaceae bacterium 3-367]|uniref:helix-turn-helix domain-containing protein n=1 Tax=Eudoraea algarum TaxID=3417568 RepID=UPI0032900186